MSSPVSVRLSSLRDRFCSELLAVLDDGEQRPQVVAVAGESGLGKSTMLAETARRALVSGHTVRRAGWVGGAPSAEVLRSLPDEGPTRPRTARLVVVDDLDRLPRGARRQLATSLAATPDARVLLLGSVSGTGTGEIANDLAEVAVSVRRLPPLDETSARILLREHGMRPGGRDAYEIVRWARGNPRAVLTLGAAFGVPTAEAVSTVTRDHAARFAGLPPQTRRVLAYLAAGHADEPYDVPARLLGADWRQALAPALAAGMVTPEDPPRFAEPIAAAAVYLLTPIHLRNEVHRALGATLPRGSAAALRHAAIAALEPDEQLASALERVARRDLADGCLHRATDAAHLAADMSPSAADAASRYELALMAATSAGDDAWVQELLARLGNRPDTGPVGTVVAAARALSLSRAGLQEDARHTLLHADVDGSDEASLAAAQVAAQSGRPEHEVFGAGTGQRVPAAGPNPLTAVDALPAGINAMVATGRWDAAERAAVAAIERARAYGLVVLEVQSRALAAAVAALRGDGRTAREQAEEAWPVLDLGSNAASHALLLRALGHAAIAESDFHTALHDFRALAELQHARPAADPVEPHLAVWIAVAALRAGEADAGRRDIERMRDEQGPSVDLQAQLAYSQAFALLTPGEEAEHYHRFAVRTAGAERWPFLLGTAHLHYGSWLRRRRRPVDARGHLSDALEVFEGLSARGFAAITRTELHASGGGSPEEADRFGTLTPQQFEVARLAAQGLSNRLIAEQLQITARTVSSHLHSAFLRLGVARRHQLRAALALESAATPSADDGCVDRGSQASA